MEIERHKLGVRNAWQGEIVSIKTGGLMAQVTVKIGRGDDALHVSSAMTRDSLEECGFKEGDTVTALVKAVNVVLGK